MPLNFGVSRVTRESAAAYSFETASAAGWVHRGYLAKWAYSTFGLAVSP